MPPRKRRKGISVTLFEDPKRVGLSFRSVGQQVSVLRKSGRTRGKSKFSAKFEPKEGWEVDLDTRAALMRIGDRMYPIIKRAVENNRNPATGRKFSETYTDREGRKRHRSMNGHYFAKFLRRTVTDSSTRWGGGFKRLSGTRSRLKFYFADKEVATINKADDARKGRGNKATRLAVGGRVNGAIGDGLGVWLDEAIEGRRIPFDTKRRARGFF